MILPIRRLTLCVLAVSLFLIPPVSGAQSVNGIYISWRPDGTMVAIAYDQQVDIVDVNTMHTVNSFTGLSHQTSEAMWSPDGEDLAIIDDDKVHLWRQAWDPNQTEHIDIISVSRLPATISSIAWSPTGDRLAILYGPLEVWNVSTVPASLEFSRKEQWATTDVAWSPSGAFIATTSLDYNIKLWDAATGTVLSTVMAVTYELALPSEYFVFTTSVSWSPDSDRLVFGADDGTVRILNIATLGEPELRMSWDDPGVLYFHSESVRAVDWNKMQPLIASGSRDGTVQIRDPDTGALLQTIQAGYSVESVAWSSDGAQLAYGGDSGSLQILRPG